ncbi:hypothetical protein YPPY66_4973 [Yersinia pestis PY-66]|nr:hypothetical protein YPPY66_4973 [Yersinia pestis PY-66]
MNFHQQTRIFIDGLPIIFQMCSVRGTHFDQLTPCLTHDIRNTKRTANLDQFTTGDHDLLARRHDR